jgi:hypothetical protein
LIIINFVHNDMKKGDSSTGIFSILFHIEDIRGYFIVF